MFSLVRYDNLEYDILPSKRVKVIEGSSCVVKYTNGAKYRANLVKSSVSKACLEKLKHKYDNFDLNIKTSTPNSSIKDIENSKDSEIVPQFSRIITKNYLKTDSTLHIEEECIGNETSTNITEDWTTKVDMSTGDMENMNVQGIVNLEDCEIEQQIDSIATENNTITTKNYSENDVTFHIEEECTGNETSNNITETSTFNEDLSTCNKENINIQELKVPTSSNMDTNAEQLHKKSSKYHFCPYCFSLQTKFARHLTLKHKNEPDVKKFLILPNNSFRRRQIIDEIRKKGDFLHNTKPEFNTGILIVSRRKQNKSRNQAEDYVCCKSCKGFFAKQTIRFHLARCDKNRQKGVRNILSTSRRLTGYLHSAANQTLRTKVFPVLNDDDIVKTIKYDELIILFGNKLCERYTLQHQHDYIRTQLRMLGRIKLEMIKFEKNIAEFKDIFQPQYCDKCILCLRKLSEWEENLGAFKVPFNAQFISSLMKKCAKKLRTECIKNQDYERKKKVDDFLLLWEEEIPTLITRKALNDQMDKRREKKVVLPSKKDIKLLYDYLRNECLNCISILNYDFELDAYKLLISCTLIYVQIFNRRRAGEIERLTLANYYNKENLNDNVDKDLYKNLSTETQQFAKQFTRLVIKGKLERTVPVLLNPLAKKCIEVILTFRKQAGVSETNEYIFCSLVKNKFAKPYIRACPLLKRFANECGAVMPNTLRGTQLRKHVATYTSMLNVEECQVDTLAQFMGHHKDIHKAIYRVPVPVSEITHVSKLLMAAIGDDQDDEEDNDNESSDTDSEVEDHIVAENHDDCNNKNQKSKSLKRFKPRSDKPVERTKWSEDEKKAITDHFGDLKSLPKLPTLKQCKEISEKYSVLKLRKPQQIFAFINNQRRRQEKS